MTGTEKREKVSNKIEFLKHRPRVVFPYIEAGMGHIMPMKSITDAFRRKYGEHVEMVEPKFLQESGNEEMIRLEKLFTDNVRFNNSHPFLGRVSSSVLNILGKRLPCRWLCKKVVKQGRLSYKAVMKYAEELNADIIFSTHFSTQYYAWQLKSKKHKEDKKLGVKKNMHSTDPISITYCTDVHLHNFFRYPADYTLVFTESAYKKHRRESQYRLKPGEGVERAGSSRVVLVPFFIREEAFKISSDKKVNRRILGLPEDKFTIVLAEGGYGIGRMQEIVEKLLEKNFPITVVPVCGKNEKLFEYFKTLKPKSERMTFHPIGFNTRMLETVAAADLFVGKSGTSSIAEPTFFGVPSIISGCTSTIEIQICRHFAKSVGSAVKITNTKKIMKAIEDFIQNPAKLEPYVAAAKADRCNYGAEQAADFLWEVCKLWSYNQAADKGSRIGETGVKLKMKAGL